MTVSKARFHGNGLLLAHGEQRHLLSPQRVYVPWTTDAKIEKTVVKARNDVHGNWLNGRRFFFGEAGCFSCHSIRGEGVAFGPDLMNLIHRDRASVLHDILQPSATINLDQAGSELKLKDGSVMQGLVRGGNGPMVTLLVAGGAKVEIERSKIAAIEPMKSSLMLAEYSQRLNKEQQEDLLTFLLLNPLEPTVITRTEPSAPPARSHTKIARMLPLPSDAAARASWNPLRILLSAGEKDHVVDEHDYPLWLQRWSKLLALADNVKVNTCTRFPTREQLAASDVTVFYSSNAEWSLEAAALLDEYQKRGGRLVYLHLALGGGKHTLPLAERVGLAFGMSAFRHGEMHLRFTGMEHPITRGFTELRLVDETYWKMHGDVKRIAVLAESMEQNEPRPQLWTMERHGGRVFGCIPGHYMWTFDDPLYRLIVLRGIAWAARQDDVERLSELTMIGARVE